MGATDTQTVWMVLLPTAVPGILTGVMLAIARGRKNRSLAVHLTVQQLLADMARAHQADAADRIAANLIGQTLSRKQIDSSKQG